MSARSDYFWMGYGASDAKHRTRPEIWNEVPQALDEIDRLRDLNTDEAARKLIADLRRQIRIMQEAAVVRNRDLDALHMIWCDGPCLRGVHRWADDLATPDELDALVLLAEHHVTRLKNKARGRRSAMLRQSVAP